MQGNQDMGEGKGALMLIGVARELTDTELAQVGALDGIDKLNQIQL